MYIYILPSRELLRLVSEMTYTVSSGTLNSSIPYHTIPTTATHTVVALLFYHFNRATHVMHSAAIAVATWLSVCHTWLSVCIVSKRMKISSTFSDHLIAPSFRFFLTPAPIPNSVSGGAKYTGCENLCDFRLKSPFISETVRDRPMVTMGR